MRIAGRTSCVTQSWKARASGLSERITSLYSPGLADEGELVAALPMNQIQGNRHPLIRGQPAEVLGAACGEVKPKRTANIARDEPRVPLAVYHADVVGFEGEGP